MARFQVFNTCGMKYPDSRRPLLIGLKCSGTSSLKLGRGSNPALNLSAGNAEDVAVGRVIKGASGSCRKGSTREYS